MKKILQVFVFLLVYMTGIAQTNQTIRNFYKDTSDIKDWFIDLKKLIDSSKTMFLLPSYPGNGYAVIIIPEKKICTNEQVLNQLEFDYYNYGSLEPEGKSIPYWSLINENDSSLGFVYKKLSDSISVASVSYENYTVDSLNKRHFDTLYTLVRYYALVVYGETKRMELPKLKGEKWYEIFVKNKKTNAHMRPDIFQMEKYQETNKDIFYFFVPKKLNDNLKYTVFALIEEGGDENTVGNKTVSLSALTKAKSMIISINSTPENCTVYMLSQSEFDLKNEADNFFVKLKNNHYIITAEAEEVMQSYILPDGPTNVTKEAYEVTYIFFIKKGNQLSPPLKIKPVPNGTNKINYKFPGS